MITALSRDHLPPPAPPPPPALFRSGVLRTHKFYIHFETPQAENDPNNNNDKDFKPQINREQARSALRTNTRAYKGTHTYTHTLIRMRNDNNNDYKELKSQNTEQVKPVLNWANGLRTLRPTMIRFLIELLVRRIWFGQSKLYFILNWLVMRCKLRPELAADAQQTA